MIRPVPPALRRDAARVAGGVDELPAPAEAVEDGVGVDGRAVVGVEDEVLE